MTGAELFVTALPFVVMILGYIGFKLSQRQLRRDREELDRLERRRHVAAE